MQIDIDLKLSLLWYMRRTTDTNLKLPPFNKVLGLGAFFCHSWKLGSASDKRKNIISTSDNQSDIKTKFTKQ